MKHDTLRFLRWTLTLTLLTVPAALLAQGPEQPPDLLLVTEVDAKPAGAATLEDLVQSHVVPGVKEAGTWLHTWRIARLGRMNSYAFVAPIKNFAQLDSPPLWVTAVGQERADRFFSQARPQVDRVRSYVVRVRRDLSYIHGEEFDVTQALFVRVTSRPGKVAEIEQMLKDDVLPAYTKLEKTFVSHQASIGGNPYEWIFLVKLDNFADLDGGHFLLRALGPEGFAQWQQKVSHLVTARLSYEVAEMMPQLSVAAQ